MDGYRPGMGDRLVRLVMPHQLFEQHLRAARGTVFVLVEHDLLFRQYAFHSHKLVLHRASMTRFADRRKAIDLAMFDPKSAEPRDARRSMGELMKERALTEEWLAAAEAKWIEATEALEVAQAAAA